MQLHQMKSELIKLITFTGVGGVATLTHLIIAVLFSTITALNPFAVNILAFSAAFPVSFLGHKHLTFKKDGCAVRFFFLSFGGFLLNNLILTSLYLNTNLKPVLMLTLSTLLTPLLTYLGARVWVFR